MSLRHAALGLLAQHPGSGYDLLKKFQESMANVWPATQSQLYGELGKLAEAGLIKVSDVGPRGRKEYAITDAGRAELLRWMTTPQDDPAFRSAPLLRVFLLDQLTAAEAREYLQSLRQHAETEHARCQTDPPIARLDWWRRLLRPGSTGVRPAAHQHAGPLGDLGDRTTRPEEKPVAAAVIVATRLGSERMQ